MDQERRAKRKIGALPHPWLTAAVILVLVFAPLWMLDRMGKESTRENYHVVAWVGAMMAVAVYFLARAVFGGRRVDGVVNRVLELLLGIGR